MKISLTEFNDRQSNNLSFFKEQLDGNIDPNLLLTYSREIVSENGSVNFVLVGLRLSVFYKCFCPYAIFLGYEYVKPFGNIPKFREFDHELEIYLD